MTRLLDWLKLLRHETREVGDEASDETDDDLSRERASSLNGPPRCSGPCEFGRAELVMDGDGKALADEGT